MADSTDPPTAPSKAPRPAPHPSPRPTPATENSSQNLTQNSEIISAGTPAKAPAKAPEKDPEKDPEKAQAATKANEALAQAPKAALSKRSNNEPATAPVKAKSVSEPSAIQAPIGQDGDAVDGIGGRFLVFAAIPSWLTSLVLHFIVLLVLAMSFLPALTKDKLNDLTLGNPDVVKDEIETFEDNGAEIQLETDALTADVSVIDAPEIMTDTPALVDAEDMEAAAMKVELSTIGFEATSSDLMQEIGAFTGSGLDGRNAAERTRLVREAGGTEGSEQAVKRALEWLKRHQNPDGSWSFFHLGGRCQCPGHGAFAEARIGATSIALLPFLGAGHTHMSGTYQAEVKKGLYFLLNHQKPTGSLWEEQGHMYSHGLGSIVLCEAYAMTGDMALQKPAQGSLNFITLAQDPITHGWRYQPRDMTGGDTSVVGWQLMALKSGHMANLYINPSTISGTSRFLDSVQANRGATYGYKAPGEKGTTSAIGLLCRMYLGWNHENEALQAGVKRLSKSGPSKVNMYYNYYATQVMRHYEGEPWEKWNEEMRDWLVESQDRRGHRDGSWYMGKEHTDKGGRLYCTAMATMILEVYYRHLPIYGKKAAEDEFEL